MKKEIAIFGGTGRTGKIFLEKALQAGYRVKVLARTPEKLGLDHTNLTVVKGDVLNAENVKKTLEGTSMVFSLFGHVKGSPAHLQTEGTRLIVSAMRDNQQKRIISLSGGGLPFPEKDEPKFADKMIRTIMKIFVPKVLNDAIDHAEVLKNSDLKWTIVRGPRLTDDPEQGQYREGWVGVNASTKISRADLASFLLTLIEDEKYVREMPFISH